MSLDNQDKEKRSEPTEKSKTFNKEGTVYYKKTKANDEIRDKGLEIINAMSDEEYADMVKRADTLHFIYLLGLASKQTNSNVSRRKVKTDTGIEFQEETAIFSTTVGVKLKTDIDIRVPFLKDVTRNKDTGIDLETDITYKPIKAGEIFDLTLYEFMYLIIDGYGGLLKVDGEDFYAHLSVKLPAFWRGDAKLPTPTIVFEKGNGSVRTRMLDIDTYSSEEGWMIKPEYKRFEPLIGKRKRKMK